MQWRSRAVVILLGFVLCTVLVWSWLLPSGGSESPLSESPPEISTPPFPELQAHPLPPSLEAWDVTSAGDYFGQVEPTLLGYLVWTEFPVRVWIDRSSESAPTSAGERFGQWRASVLAAVREWSVYLPLTEVEMRDDADIAIARRRPPLAIVRDRITGLTEFGAARTAQTRFEFYARSHPDGSESLLQRMTVEIGPEQSAARTLATARHELGHALGIWGHSPDPGDALYAAHVPESPKISARDINTLKRIYQQPTRLGWLLLTEQTGNRGNDSDDDRSLDGQHARPYIWSQRDRVSRQRG
ncbi:putative Zn-dependent protease [Rubidibacter lacunae KORDI 51-2]|uniref:Putative Zn-dependent protease n=1 Tax=Rubidibacter lacunae KORDI 51-2 TaxID=582515 RepID=U5DPT7_9CHRO|nr:matrixin family metalloprotease [Rubidibacter lacunae]ERN42604.1 putative Zn-dependent protease [Rubidibacter lacunae KORDI 51-2]